jgi:prevent-host-death family protein
MTQVSIKDAKNRLTELARRVEKGERVTITRHGKPVLDLVPHKAESRSRLELADEFRKKHGYTELIGQIPKDFDDPLPEDFLLRPLP